MICGICGVAPKVEMAHRNEENVLALKSVEVSPSQPPYPLSELSCHWAASLLHAVPKNTWLQSCVGEASGFFLLQLVFHLRMVRKKQGWLVCFSFLFSLPTPFLLMMLEIKHRVSCMLGRHAHRKITPPMLICFLYLRIEPGTVYILSMRSVAELQS